MKYLLIIGLLFLSGCQFSKYNSPLYRYGHVCDNMGNCGYIEYGPDDSIYGLPTGKPLEEAPPEEK